VVKDVSAAANKTSSTVLLLRPLGLIHSHTPQHPVTAGGTRGIRATWEVHDIRDIAWVSLDSRYVAVALLKKGVGAEGATTFPRSEFWPPTTPSSPKKEIAVECKLTYGMKT